jgi:hypothetical protein
MVECGSPLDQVIPVAGADNHRVLYLQRRVFCRNTVPHLGSLVIELMDCIPAYSSMLAALRGKPQRDGGRLRRQRLIMRATPTYPIQAFSFG